MISDYPIYFNRSQPVAFRNLSKVDRCLSHLLWIKAHFFSCMTRSNGHHYLGFQRTQWKLFEKETPHRVKTLLYVFRVQLTGVHLMQTGQVEANLLQLNELFCLPYIPEWITRKLACPEKFILDREALFLFTTF